MSLEEYTPDLDSGGEAGGQSAEGQQEKLSEKFRESVKRGQAGIQRTAKDEKKAKKKDLILANFLVKIILDTRYDTLLDDLFATMDAGHPSNIILGILSLVYPEISDTIRDLSGKQKVIFDYVPHDEKELFDDAHVDDQIKARMNDWISDIIDIVTIEHSSIMVERVQKSLGVDKNLLNFTRKVFVFFLQDLNIEIDTQKSQNIAHFILDETLKTIATLEIEKI